MRTTRLRLAVLVCATFAGSSAAATAVPPALPGCDRLVVSPDYTNDRTAFCAGVDFVGHQVRLYVTHDRAHSWSTSTAAGLPSATSPLVDFAISPLFAHDRLLVASFSSGVYYSTDAGSTFQPAPLLTAPVTLVPSLAATPNVPDPLAAVGSHSVILSVGQRSEPGASGSIIFDPIVPNVRAAAGTDGIDRAFVASPDYVHDRTAFAVGAIGSTPSTTTETLYTCDIAFTCRTPLYTFAAGQSVDRVWFAADYTTSGTLFATTINTITNRTVIYLSTNSGRTFAVIPTLQSAVIQLDRAGTRAAVAFAPTTNGSRIIFARVSGGVSAPNPPSERLFRSDDNGRTWHLVSFGRLPGAKGSPGTMPYAYGYAPSESVPTPTGLLTYTPDGRMLMTGQWWNHGRTVWCSTTRGATWAPRCP